MRDYNKIKNNLKKLIVLCNSKGTQLERTGCPLDADKALACYLSAVKFEKLLSELSSQ